MCLLTVCSWSLAAAAAWQRQRQPPPHLLPRVGAAAGKDSLLVLVLLLPLLLPPDLLLALLPKAKQGGHLGRCSGAPATRRAAAAVVGKLGRASARSFIRECSRCSCTAGARTWPPQAAARPPEWRQRSGAAPAAWDQVLSIGPGPKGLQQQAAHGLHRMASEKVGARGNYPTLESSSALGL